MTWSSETIYGNPKFRSDGTYIPGPYNDVGVAIWNMNHHKIVYLESTDGTFRCRVSNGRFGILRTYAENRAEEKDEP